MQDKIEIIKPLIYAIELRDPYTKGHSQRVAKYAVEFAKHLDLSKEVQKDLFYAGLLHDIGKISIPDSILLKPSLLNSKEYEVIKNHTVFSEMMVKKLDPFKYLAKAIRSHHENYDGTGYPDRLKGDEIPFLSRILALADVFDALTTQRIYRRAFTLRESLNIMDNMRSKFFPSLYGKFVEFIEKFGVYEIKENMFEKEEEDKIKALRNSVFFEDILTGLLNKNALLLLIRRANELKMKLSLIELQINDFNILQHSNVSAMDKVVKITSAEIKSLLSVSELKTPSSEDVFVFRSGFKYMVMFFENDEVYGKLQKLKEKINSLNLGFTVDYEVLVKDKTMDYNFERVMEYII